MTFSFIFLFWDWSTKQNKKPRVSEESWTDRKYNLVYICLDLEKNKLRAQFNTTLCRSEERQTVSLSVWKLTDFIVNLHCHVVGIHDQFVFRVCLDWSSHCTSHITCLSFNLSLLKNLGNSTTYCNEKDLSYITIV